jgi:general nucleoside transport system permease protein
MLHDLAFATIRIATPLVFAALGGLLTYQAGILNVALDGFMIVGAFFGIWAAFAFHSLAAGILGAIASGMALAYVLGVFAQRFKADVFIAGLALTFLAYSVTNLLLQGVFGQDGVFQSDTIPSFQPIRLALIADLPVLGDVLSGHTPLVYVAYLAVPLVALVLYRTRWGLRVRMTGEAEDAATAAGVPAARLKMQTLLLSGLFCGLAGAYLSLDYVSLFSKQMTSERGLIALAAIFFAKGRPFATAAVAILFGAATALAVRLPSVTNVAPQLLQTIPYVCTVLALIAVGGRDLWRRRAFQSERAPPR